MKNGEEVAVYLDGEKIATSKECSLTVEKEGIDIDRYEVTLGNELITTVNSFQEFYEIAKEYGVHLEHYLVKPENKDKC